MNDIIMNINIINRFIEIKEINNSFPRMIIYGRRKTGKSFLIENFIKYDKYFFVNRDRTIYNKLSGELYNYNEFIRLLREIIGEKKI
ncbi:hypothetical protein YN1_1340 [Nanoarchaeota archaeon]